MTEYCFQSTKINNNNNKKPSDFTLLFSFILSHPLYFSYLIFFSPYLFKLLSFLSPLFLTTFLLVLSLLTTLIPLHSILNSKEGVFLTAYNTLLEKLHPNLEDEGEESHQIEEFEVYKAVFDIPTIEVIEETPVENEKIEEHPVEFFEEKEEVYHEVKKTEDKCESLTMEEEKVGTKPKNAKVEEIKKKFESIAAKESRGSEAKTPTKSASLKSFNNDERNFSESFSQTLGVQPSYMGSFGSMRKEKEWRRTLACKLFEERHNGSNTNSNVSGGVSEEGMDLLWETYEAETESNRGKSKEGENKKSNKKRDHRIEELMMVNDDEDEYYEDNGKLCCLQALKLSAGKMNLSMGMKFIPKAFKGIGLLQNHVRKQGKKGYK